MHTYYTELCTERFPFFLLANTLHLLKTAHNVGPQHEHKNRSFLAQLADPLWSKVVCNMVPQIL